MGHADLGDHAGDQELLLARGLHGLDEVLVVPGVDLAGAGNVGRVGKLGLQLGHQRAVGAVLEAGGQHRGQLEVTGDVGQGQHVVLELVGVDVAHQREQAGLVVDQQHGDIVLVETGVRLGHGRLPL
ncbi:hypothetical protein VCH24_30630 [Variovorax boronicumulans]|nr:hypothetical protein VCH24_30630 [Variovorax boronicumulans]